MEDLDRPTFVHLALTPEQQEQVKRSTGRDSLALRLTIDDLEQRIVPGRFVNHNESLLVEPLEERINPAGYLNHNESLMVEPLEERINPAGYMNHNETML